MDKPVKEYSCGMCGGHGERFKKFDYYTGGPVTAMTDSAYMGYCELCDGTGKVTDYRKAILEDRIERLEQIVEKLLFDEELAND